MWLVTALIPVVHLLVMITAAQRPVALAIAVVVIAAVLEPAAEEEIVAVPGVVVLAVPTAVIVTL